MLMLQSNEIKASKKPGPCKLDFPV